MNTPTETPTAPEPITPPVGEIRGTAVIRDEHGNVKGTFEFSGTTPLTEAELREQLFS